MTKQEIIRYLNKNHIDFVTYIEQLDDKQFMFAPPEKWTAGQQLDHVYRSVSPVLMAFRLPKLVPSLLFGKANRPSKNYDSLKEKYYSKLGSGAVASGRFIPKPVDVNRKENLKRDLLNTVAKLCKQVDKCSEDQLDKYILPHPLLGKITFREMLYFTIYHVEHHRLLTIKYLEEANK